MICMGTREVYVLEAELKQERDQEKVTSKYSCEGAQNFLLFILSVNLDGG